MKNLCLILLAIVFASLASTAEAGSTASLRDICRLKGQEENTLNGLGLVVGLNGTGEAGDAATMRNLARAMELMGSPVSLSGRLDAESLKELEKIKNVALVMVTATVPPTGARRGDKIDCHVSALNGKGLEGGRLAFAALQGPNVQDRRVYALCQGSLQIDDPAQPMVARVHGGAQLQQDIFTPFHKDGYVTLVLDKNHADFLTAYAIVEVVHDNYSQYIEEKENDYETQLLEAAHAIDAANIRVRIPEIYKNDPVGFVATLLELSIYYAEPEARVVVNPRSGSIVISGDVEIGDVVVTHRNLVIEATSQATFASVDLDEGDTNQAKLNKLVTALGNLRVPADDIIEIIRGIDRLGKLHARLIIE